MKRALGIAALLLLAAPVAHAAEADGAKPSPVAVMPFKNLNGDASIDWLKAGIAETMISDLKKSGRMQVVERDQIDKAMAEIALQGANGTEESTAAKLGKMVGAKTVVLGGFQKAGNDLRITARFVVVETGVILDTAKATGKMRDIFSLQDEITARLLGEKPPQAIASAKHGGNDKFTATNTLSFVPPRKPATDKTLQAYKLYAMALSSGSDADRVSYLKQSLQIDPDFTYSSEALDALEKRMAGYEQAHDQAVQQGNGDLRAKLAAASTDQDRYLAATQLLSSDISSRRYRVLIEDATHVAKMGIPPYYGQDPREMAADYVFIAYRALNETDHALQAGEAYMKEFPNGQNFSSVQMQMNAMIEEKRKADDAPAAAQAKIAELEKDHAEAMKRPDHRLADRTYEFGRCSAWKEYGQYDHVLQDCAAFADHWKDDADPTTQQLVFIARWDIGMEKAQAGRFDDARAIFRELIAADPKRSQEMGLKSMLDTWPQD